MGITAANSLHAAGSFRVGADTVLSQSPNGMLLTKFIVDEDPEEVWFQILFDYPLDPGSCAYSCAAFIDTDPATEDEAGQPFLPMLLHINDKEKLLFLLNDEDFPAESVERNFHIQFTNYAANLSEQLPVVVVDVPGP